MIDLPARGPRDVNELRGRLLTLCLTVVTASLAAYVGVGYVEIIESQLFPVDAVWWLMGCAISAFLVHRGQQEQAALIFVSCLLMPIPYFTLYQGVGNPINYAFMFPIVMAGLLIGGRSMLCLAAFCSLLLAVAGYSELQHWHHPNRSVVDFQDYLSRTILWTAIFMQAGWVVWLLDRTLERMILLSRGQAATLVRAATALASTPDAEQMVAEVAKAVGDQLQVEHASMWIHCSDQDSLRLAMLCVNGQSDPIADSPELPACDAPVWAALNRHRTPVLLDESAIRSARVFFPMGEEGLRSMLVAPLLLGDELQGWIGFGSRSPRTFTSHEIDLVVAQAPAFLIAMQLQQQARKDQKAAVAEERNRMAREIHDTLAQGYAAIIIQLDLALDLVGEHPNEARGRILRAQRLARENLDEARRALVALRSAKEQGIDLSTALRRLVDTRSADHGIPTRLVCEGEQRPLPADTEGHLYRIAQEALNNAIRHSGAKEITVHLRYEPDSVSLTVKDDGSGFDARQSVALNDRFGLTGIRERAARLGGDLELETAPGYGTSLHVTAHVA